MSIWGIVLGVLLAIVSVAIIVVIILQEGNQQGIGAVTGVADSYFSKNKARSIDAFLSRWTKVFAAIFVTFITFAILHFLGKNKHPFKRSLLSMTLGAATLFAVNLTGAFTGVTLPISLLSLLVSIIGGIPGVTLMLGLNLFF